MFGCGLGILVGEVFFLVRASVAKDLPVPLLFGSDVIFGTTSCLANESWRVKSTHIPLLNVSHGTPLTRFLQNGIT